MTMQAVGRLIVLSLLLVTAQACERVPGELEEIPPDFSYQNKDVQVKTYHYELSDECKFHLPHVSTTDAFTSVHVHYTCTPDSRVLDLSSLSGSANNSAGGGQLLYSILLQDCEVSWDTINELGSRANIIRLQIIADAPEYKLTTNKQLTGLANLTYLHIAVLNLQKKLNLADFLPPSVMQLHNVSEFQLKVIGSSQLYGGFILFSHNQLETLFPVLQSLVLEGPCYGSDRRELGFPWNDVRVPLPFGLKYSTFYQELYPNEEWINSNMMKRSLMVVGQPSINISTVCGMKGLLHEVTFSRNKLTHIPGDCFANVANNLSFLDLSDNPLVKLEENLLRNMSSLQTLRLSKIGLYETKVGFFDDLTNLRWLNLAHNNLTQITSGTFDKLPLLEQISLRDNQIEKIEEGSLPKYSKYLTFVDVRWNNLTAIPADCFTLPKLERCACDDNYITIDNLPPLIEKFDSTEMRMLQPFSFSNTSFHSYRVIRQWSRPEISLKNNNISEMFTISKEPNVRQKYTGFLKYFQLSIGHQRSEMECDCNLHHLQRFLRDEHISSPTSQSIYATGLEPTYFQSWLCRINPLLLPLSDHTKSVLSFLNVKDNEFFCQNTTMKHCPKSCTCAQTPAGSVVINCENRHVSKTPRNLPEGTELIVSLKAAKMAAFPDCNDKGYSWLRNVTSLDMSHGHLTPSTENFAAFLKCLQNIKYLNLESNFIETLPKSINSTRFIKLSLQFNELKCNCSNPWMKKWLRHNNDSILNADSLRCSNIATPKPIVELEDSDLCESLPTTAPPNPDPAPNIPVILTVAFLIAAFSVIAVYKRKQIWRRLTHEDRVTDNGGNVSEPGENQPLLEEYRGQCANRRPQPDEPNVHPTDETNVHQPDETNVHQPDETNVHQPDGIFKTIVNYLFGPYIGNNSQVQTAEEHDTETE